MRPRRVRRLAQRLHSPPQAALVDDGRGQVRRLADHRPIELRPRPDVGVDSTRQVLLVHGAEENGLRVQVVAHCTQQGQRIQHRRQRALRVARSPAVDSAARHAGRQRVGHRLERDGIHVRLEQQRLRRPRRREPPEDVEAAGQDFLPLDRAAQLGQVLGDKIADLSLARAVLQLEVHALDGDEPTQQADDLPFVCRTLETPHRASFLYLFLSRGSSAPVNPSPIRFTAMMVMTIPRPGNVIIHHDSRR